MTCKISDIRLKALPRAQSEGRRNGLLERRAVTLGPIETKRPIELPLCVIMPVLRGFSFNVTPNNINSPLSQMEDEELELSPTNSETPKDRSPRKGLPIVTIIPPPFSEEFLDPNSSIRRSRLLCQKIEPNSSKNRPRLDTAFEK